MSENKYVFAMNDLPYEYNALEPYIDTDTMKYHHDKHLNTYITNLNKALEPYPQIQAMDLEQILKQPLALPNVGSVAIMRNAGGVYNHNFFFNILRAGREENAAVGNLSFRIEKQFGNFEKFKNLFTEEALKVFGSGYLWLAMDSKCILSIVPTTNQETPLSMGFQPIITIDLWEHAYYLKNQNRRNEYIDAWWHVVNWDIANRNYAACM
ncbi:MAG: superoxide dismutase [Clostridiales bacterium]|jgi:Fe-Mn family superoxide dismutase|nr:superoxide dismutase [Clostridiales bacterium]